MSFINGWTKETVIAHIKAKFKGQSIVMDRFKTCMYRGPKGKQCAVGMFLPDKAFHKGFESLPIRTLLLDSPKLCEYMPLTTDKLMKLQLVHDDHKRKRYEHKSVLLNKLIDFINNL